MVKITKRTHMIASLIHFHVHVTGLGVFALAHYVAFHATALRRGVHGRSKQTNGSISVRNAARVRRLRSF